MEMHSLSIIFYYYLLGIMTAKVTLKLRENHCCLFSYHKTFVSLVVHKYVLRICTVPRVKREDILFLKLLQPPLRPLKTPLRFSVFAAN